MLPDISGIEVCKKLTVPGKQYGFGMVGANDATLMRDTSTTAYYDQLVQIFHDMVNGGVKSIALVDISWGPITLQGTSSAQATTVETWSTTMADGSTLQETDTNVYSLVLEGDAWKVQDDQHSNTRAQQPTTGNPGSTTPVTPSVPADPAGSGQSQSGNWSGYNATGSLRNHPVAGCRSVGNYCRERNSNRCQRGCWGPVPDR